MPRPRLHDAALRRRLLDVSSEAISRRGPEGVSLRVLAAQAGTTTAAIYTLFGSREQLIEAVATEGFERFGAHLAAVQETDDAGADLLALGLAYRNSALTDPHFYRVMFGVAPPRDASTSPPFTALRTAVGRVAPAGVDTAVVAYRLWSLVHGLVDLELAGHLPGTDQERAARYERTLGLLGPALFA